MSSTPATLVMADLTDAQRHQVDTEIDQLEQVLRFGAAENEEVCRLFLLELLRAEGNVERSDVTWSRLCQLIERSQTVNDQWAQAYATTFDDLLHTFNYGR